MVTRGHDNRTTTLSGSVARKWMLPIGKRSYTLSLCDSLWLDSS
jgi:hypothetical protein